MQVIKYLFLVLFLLSSFLTQAQEKVTISGYLTDITSGEALLFGNISMYFPIWDITM